MSFIFIYIYIISTITTKVNKKGGKIMNNKDIRDLIAENKLKYWRVADRCDLSDSQFSRLLRHPLKQELREKVLKAIEDMKEEK